MALIDRSIRLTERGTPAIVPEADWQSLEMEEPCRVLAEKGIIGLKRIGAFRVIEPRQFVGHLRLPGRAVTISPYAKELFNSLHKFVISPPDKKVVAEDAHTDATARHIVDPAVAFYKALSEATNAGLPSSYERKSSTTSRPRGRLLLNETFRSLRTRGVSHKVVCSFNVRLLDSNFGAIISTVNSLLNTSYDLPPTLQLRISRLVELFEGGQILSNRQAYGKTTALLREYSEQQELSRLLEICQAILADEQIVWDTEIPISGGECRFSNMDRLWELAVWTAFKEAAAGKSGLSTEFHPFAYMNISLLTDGGPKIDPDIVIFKKGKPFIVVDAKYSEAKSAAADDVYQIVCYTQRLKSAKGALVYLSERDSWSKTLGRTEDTSEILAAGVSSQSNVVFDLIAIARQILNTD